MPATQTPRALSPAPDAPSSGWKGTVAVALVFLAQWLTWLVLYRWLLFTGDDYLHTGGPRRLHGQMTAGEILQSYVRDYTEINGRAADTLARVVMQSGVTGWQLLGPVVITLISVVAYRVILSEGGRPMTAVRLWLAALVVSVPFMLLALRPALAGQVYYWVSAAVGYLVGVLLLLLAGSFYLAVRRTRLSTAAMAAFAVLMVVTHLYHETASVGLLVMGVAFWLYHPRTDVDRRAAWVSLASLAGFLANLFAPGSISRLFMATDADAPGALSLMARFAQGATMLHMLVWPAVLVITAAAVVLAVRRFSLLRLAVVLFGVVTTALGVVRAARGADVRVLDGAERMLPWVFAAFLVLALTVAFTQRRAIGYATVHLLAGAAGCAAIPVVVGALERGHLPAALLAWFAAASFLLDVVRRRPSTSASPAAPGGAGWLLLAAVVLPILLVAPATAVHTYRATHANHTMWTRTERQIAEAVQGHRDTVEFPDTRAMPFPDHVYNNAYLMRRYEPMIRSYYGLDEDVTVVIAKR